MTQRQRTEQPQGHLLIPTKQGRTHTKPGIFLCGALDGGGGPLAGAMEVLEHAGTAAERGPIIYEAHVPTTRMGIQPPEYTPVKIGHVQRIVGAFKSKPGLTEAEVRTTRALSPFGDGKKPFGESRESKHCHPKSKKTGALRGCCRLGFIAPR